MITVDISINDLDQDYLRVNFGDSNAKPEYKCYCPKPRLAPLTAILCYLCVYEGGVEK